MTAKRTKEEADAALLERFAVSVLPAIMTSSMVGCGTEIVTITEVARKAWAVAEAMMKERPQ